MSYLELDDGILDHPKFIRAVKLGGSGAVHLWLGLRAYCGKHLTDGFIPEDMVDEVRGPAPGKARDSAMAALRKSGLIDEAEGGVQMHDYLQWSKSREAVLRLRSAARERQAKFRGSHDRTDAVSNGKRNGVTSPSVTVPTPLHSSPLQTNTPPTSPDPDRETICPLNMLERLEAAGVFKELSEKLGLSEAALREEARDTLTYWTLKAGAGKKRRNWTGVFRTRIVERAEQGLIFEPEGPEEGAPPEIRARVAALREGIGG